MRVLFKSNDILEISISRKLIAAFCSIMLIDFILHFRDSYTHKGRIFVPASLQELGETLNKLKA